MVEPAHELHDDAFWREYLTVGHRAERTARRFLVRIPDSPRCKACAAPFAGPGRRLMRLMNRRPSEHNPHLCNQCFDYMRKHRGGAEIECTLLFADVRGSTTIAENMRASDYQALLNRFYGAAMSAVFGNDGSVDKFVGDEVMAMFFHLAAGDDHAAKGVKAARELLEATGHADPGGPWLPIGAGVHTGQAWVGAVGTEAHVEFTALGDAVNTAARLAGQARVGEVVVSASAAAAAGVGAGMERESVTLKGKEQPVEIVRLIVGPDRAVAA